MKIEPLEPRSFSPPYGEVVAIGQEPGYILHMRDDRANGWIWAKPSSPRSRSGEGVSPEQR
ncbi:hypothetical protein ACFPYJ_15740 [Paenibacillus solisilvae]|uniref:SH3 domain-containing protein n=1 Tax=Paenibacillus solisilvae TaxID=2486751 RepID=A0ABW0W0A8_9BACL